MTTPIASPEFSPEFNLLPPTPASPKKHTARNVVLIVIGAVVVLIVLIASLAGGGGPSGYNNPTNLAASVQSTFNTPANQAEDGYYVSDTNCIQNSTGNTFTCIYTESDDGSQDELTVTVAADGQSWISHAYSG
jgi:hypothetical protein